MAAFAVSATAQFTRLSVSLSVELLISSGSHTHQQPGWDRIALSSILKGQSHAHSDTRTQAGRRTLVWRQCTSPEFPDSANWHRVRLQVPVPPLPGWLYSFVPFYFYFTPQLFLGWLVIDWVNSTEAHSISVWPSIFGWKNTPWSHFNTGRQIQYGSIRVRFSRL